jgi:hypothetical protein
MLKEDAVDSNFIALDVTQAGIDSIVLCTREK